MVRIHIRETIYYHLTIVSQNTINNYVRTCIWRVGGGIVNTYPAPKTKKKWSDISFKYTFDLSFAIPCTYFSYDIIYTPTCRIFNSLRRWFQPLTSPELIFFLHISVLRTGKGDLAVQNWWIWHTQITGLTILNYKRDNLFKSIYHPLSYPLRVLIFI